MLQVKQDLLAALAAELEKLSPGAGAKAAFELPKQAAHGDWATNAAMQLAKPLRQNPRALGEQLKAALEAQPAYQQWVSAIEIAGPGFLNIRLKPEAKQQVVREVLQAGAHYGVQPSTGSKVLVEFVSANPTGPLHVGHGRQAALGDAICHLLATQGWAVTREFYYNDAGVQIDTLTKSTQLRAKGFKPGDAQWPEAAYNGDYIQDIANDYLAKKSVHADDREFTASGDVDDLDNIRQFAVAYLRNEQDKDLQAFGLHFDNYYLESSLYSDGRVERAVQQLIAKGHTYEKDGALWLRTTAFGDDKDRVMKKSAVTTADGRKSEGGYTYFVPDVAYHQAKWERGFTKAINIQGTDHHGTIARVRAGLQGLDEGIPQGYPDYVLHTMVRVVKGGEEVKISKRAGSYVTLRDLIEWTSADAVRFFLLSRKPDTEYTFDVDLAVQKNNENPVFYVQYAHARICSVLAAALAHARGDRPDISDKELAESDVGAQEVIGEAISPSTLSGIVEILQLEKADLSMLSTPAAEALLLKLAQYPDMLRNAAQDFAPHDITFYLRELAASYHSYYDAERILVDDAPTRLARLALVAATRQVLANGLALLGVSAPEKM